MIRAILRRETKNYSEAVFKKNENFNSLTNLMESVKIVNYLL